jgi:hypothetical protein
MPTQPETPTRKIPDKCLRCAALSADQAKVLHGVDGNGCWDRKVCPSRRSYIRHRDRAEMVGFQGGSQAEMEWDG